MQRLPYDRRAVLSLLAGGGIVAACGGDGSGEPVVAAPAPTPTPAPSPTPSTFNVQAASGSAAGDFRQGGLVHIFADARGPNSGEVFDRWDGPDAGSLADARSWHTTLTMPGRDVVIAARYRSAAVWTPSVETVVAGSGGPVTLHWHVPPTPRGLILMLHGRGGAAANLFSRTENLAFALDAVARGFGVAALDSHDRVTNEWDQFPDLNTNIDLRNVRAALNLLLARGQIARTTPLFTLGTSAGSFFSAKVVGLLSGTVTGFTDWRAGALYIGQGGPPPLVATLTVPLRYNLQQNDSHPDISNAAALAQYEAQRARGLVSEAALNPPSPLYPKRFMRITDVSAADSADIFEAFRAGGMLDSQGYQRAHPSQSNWQALLPARFASIETQIRDQLNVAFAEHQFFADFNNATLAFYERRLA
jgi:hypothetical protein